MPAYSHFTRTDRLKLESLYNTGMKPKEIAKYLHKHISSVYREIKRGLYSHLTSDYLYIQKYSADLADSKATYNSTAKGAPLKLGNDWEFLNCVEALILQGYSPAAALGYIKNHNLGFKTHVCIATLYNYIDNGLFRQITNKHLPRKGKRKRVYHKVNPAKRPPRGESIERRPDSIDARAEFGHWEMDSVVGKQNKGQSLLVLTERQTRYEIALKVHGKTAASTISALDKIERTLGTYFPAVFKTITVDNGSEFSACVEMEHSCLFDKQRTKLYYCHPYSSWERGSNENQNAMIRRFIPKGYRLERYTHQYIKQAIQWINAYPRKIFDYQSSQHFFDIALSKLNIPENILKNFRTTY